MQEPTSRYQEMSKSAFVKNIQQTHNSNSGGKRSLVRRRRPTITADVAFEMVMDLSSSNNNNLGCSDKKKKICQHEPSSIGNNTKSTSSSLSSSSCSIEEPQKQPHQQQQQEMQHRGFREDYALGQTLRTTSDMISFSTRKQAQDAVASLKNHDFAFVKRSDNTYSYAILAYRTEESLTFVMCEEASTKNVSRKYWGELVRLVSAAPPAAVALSQKQETNVTSSKKKDESEMESAIMYLKKLKKTRSSDNTLPAYIFTPSRCSSGNDDDDDCSSVISDITLPRL